jgi:hypothetical protein
LPDAPIEALSVLRVDGDLYLTLRHRARLDER